MLPASEVDLTKVKYDPGEIEGIFLNLYFLIGFVTDCEMKFILMF